MNHTVFVGRIVGEPSVETTESGSSVSKITVAVPRPYKNHEGVYETDFIDCTLWNSTAERTAKYCKKGDVIGISGRIETNISADKEGEKKKYFNVVAEKITFISSKQKVHENEVSHDDFDLDMDK